MPFRVGIVDDDPDLCWAVSAILEGAGYQSQVLPNGAEALRHGAGATPCDAMLLDITLPDMSGAEVLSRLRASGATLPVIVLSALGSPEEIVRMVQLGASSYLTKPFDSAKLLAAIEAGIHHAHSPRDEERSGPARQLLSEAMGSSRAVDRLIAEVEAAARTDFPVLVTGESGSGKELVAHALHLQSARAGGPWVALDCGSIAESLVEDAFFGHAKGSYTGATGETAGAFHRARGGTLFLDEISNLSHAAQARLLRAIETMEGLPIGGGTLRHYDFRLICATNTDLSVACRAGAFREDLFHRLHVLSIELAPLRARPEDLPFLIDRTLRHLKERLDHRVQGVVPEALRAMQDYAWPGNVRELQNMLLRAVVKSAGSAAWVAPPLPAQPARDAFAALPGNGDLAGALLAPSESSCYERALRYFRGCGAISAPQIELARQVREGVERALITLVLEQCGGNRTAAARMLQMDVKTLRVKLTQLERGTDTGRTA